MCLTLDTLIHPTGRLWLEILSLGLMTIIGIALFGIAPALLMVENILIQIVGISLLIGLSFSIFKIIKLLENGIIVTTILKNFSNDHLK